MFPNRYCLEPLLGVEIARPLPAAPTLHAQASLGCPPKPADSDRASAPEVSLAPRCTSGPAPGRSTPDTSCRVPLSPGCRSLRKAPAVISETLHKSLRFTSSPRNSSAPVSPVAFAALLGCYYFLTKSAFTTVIAAPLSVPLCSTSAGREA